MILVALGEVARGVEVFGRADDFKLGARFERVLNSFLNE